jgi:1-aminocyclopropane-1-carboxylate deaminase/D-cysteine desulfhydrase-like pyridoxal-dependent ACC family enzyme
MTRDDLLHPVSSGNKWRIVALHTGGLQGNRGYGHA